MPTKRGGYYVDGRRVPGVTTAQSDWPEGAIRWAEENAAQCVAEVAGLDFDLVDAGLAEWRARRKDATDAGTYVHWMIERHLGMDEVEPDVSPTAEERGRVAFAHWLTWWATLDCEILHIEEHLISKRHLYGGTPDLVVRINDTDTRPPGVYVYDWKSAPEPKLKSSHLSQLGAYGIALEEKHGYDLAGVGIVTLPTVEEGSALETVVPWSDMMPACVAFLAMRTTYEAKKDLEKLRRGIERSRFSEALGGE